MKNLKKTLSNLFLATAIVFSLSNKAFSEIDFSQYILEPMPSWYEERFIRGHLDINKMIKDGYTRAEAIEIQNQMKDTLELDPYYLKLENEGKSYKLFKNKDTLVIKALEKAIKNVKENRYFESGYNPNEKLKANDFYVVFDLDETLLVQWYKLGEKGEKYYDFTINTEDNILRPLLTSPKYISMNPGLQKMIKELNAIPHCKGVIFFSAKLDKPTLEIVENMKIDGKSVKNFIKGIYTRNHLVRDQDPTKLAKDLRMIDESLKQVIIVDDNPTRLPEKQTKNIRQITKYNPDDYLKAKLDTNDKVTVDYYEKVLPIVLKEIKEADEYATKNKIKFVDAYYPYSMSAQTKLLSIIKEGYSLSEAVDIIRKNKDLFDPQFYFYEPKK